MNRPIRISFLCVPIDLEPRYKSVASLHSVSMGCHSTNIYNSLGAGEYHESVGIVFTRVPLANMANLMGDIIL